MFKILNKNRLDKFLVIKGPLENLVIDFDDVDQEEALKYAEKIVNILNIYWECWNESGH